MTDTDARLIERVIRWVKCRLGRHAFRVIGRCGIASLHVGCRACGREWGMNHDARALLPWLEVEGFHAEHGYDAAAHRAALESSK